MKLWIKQKLEFIADRIHKAKMRLEKWRSDRDYPIASERSDNIQLQSEILEGFEKQEENLLSQLSPQDAEAYLSYKASRQPTETPRRKEQQSDDAATARAREQLEKSFTSQAQTFVKSEIMAGRLVPAQKTAFVSLFVQAAKDDFDIPLAAGSRLEFLKAKQQTQLPHSYFKESVDAEANRTAFVSRNETSEMKQAAADQVDNYLTTVGPETAGAEIKIVPRN